MKFRFTSVIVMIIMLFTMVISACMPPEATAEEMAALEKARLDSVRQANASYCNRYLSFASSYYSNKGYADALVNYHKLFDYECVDEKLAPNVYVYMGNSYRELDHLDSAIIIYDEGLQIIPDNKALWDNKLYVLKGLGDDDLILQTKLDMFAQFPADIPLGIEIAEEYILNELYDEATVLVKSLLQSTPDDKNLLDMNKQIVEATGGDIVALLQEEYQNNPGNIANSKEYALILRESGENTAAISVYENILNLAPELIEVMKDLVQVYGEEGQTKAMISWLKKVNIKNPTDVRVYYDMTQAYIMDGQLKTAMSWAGKAINLDKNNGQSYYNRASVYEAVATACASSVPDFDDKLVFMMAYEEYKIANAKGYGRATKKIDFLKEARIPQSGDWFFNKDDYVKGGKALPKKECYTWLKRSVNAPKK